jgi:thiamine biosynthesis protein ThiS
MRAVRARLRTPRCYLVSRGDGRVVLGATVEEQGFDTAVTADGVFRLLEAAWEVLPEVGELELVGAARGLRPGTPDNAPVVGPASSRADLGDRPLAQRRAAGAADGRRRRRPARGRRCPTSSGAEPGAFGGGARMTVVTINGEPRSCATAHVEVAVRAAGAPDGRGVAVALDGEVVPRGEWATTRCATASRSRCCTRCRAVVTASAFEIAGRALESRLILGTGGFRNLEVMAEAARESAPSWPRWRMRRVDPSARGSIVEVLEEAGSRCSRTRPAASPRARP